MGCNPIPIKSNCDVPSFTVTQQADVIQYFNTKGQFEKYCPIKTPERISYQITETSKITIRVRGEWLDLSAMDNGVLLPIEANGIRKLEFDGFTHMIRLDSLRNNKLSIKLPETGVLDFSYSLTTCTCVEYDAI